MIGQFKKCFGQVMMLSVFLAGCATSEAETVKPEEPAAVAVEAPKVEPPPAIRAHQLPQCVQKGSVIAWGGTTQLTEKDLDQYNQAIDGCPARYPGSPCLRVFIVLGSGQYRVICGPDDAAAARATPPDPGI